MKTLFDFLNRLSVRAQALSYLIIEEALAAGGSVPEFPHPGTLRGAAPLGPRNGGHALRGGRLPRAAPPEGSPGSRQPEGHGPAPFRPVRHVGDAGRGATPIALALEEVVVHLEVFPSNGHARQAHGYTRMAGPSQRGPRS